MGSAVMEKGKLLHWERILREDYRKEERLNSSMKHLYLFPPEMKPISYDTSKLIDLYTQGIGFILRTGTIGRKIDFVSTDLLQALKSYNNLLTAGMFAPFCERLKKSLQEAAYAKGVMITITFICSKDQLKFTITGKI